MDIIFADILLTATAVIWLIVAAIQDIKKREVANWLNFSLLIIALAIRATAAVISSHYYYFTDGLIALGVFFIITNLFYYGRIFAGGDAKLLIALAVAFATTPAFVPANPSIPLTIFANLPFLATFLINVLFVGSVYGLVYSIVLASTHFRQFKAEFKKINKTFRLTRILCLIIFLAFLVASVKLKENFLWVLSLMFFLFPYLLIFVKSVENSCMIKDIRPENLTEGDWLFKPVKAGKKLIMPKWEGLTKKEIALIKNSKIRKISIKQGLPFVPVFLIALILSFFTNLLVFILGFFV